MGQRAPRGGSTAKLYRRLCLRSYHGLRQKALTCEEFLPLYQHQVTSRGGSLNLHKGTPSLCRSRRPRLAGSRPPSTSCVE